MSLRPNDLHSPFVEVVFFENEKGMKASEKEVKDAAGQLEPWYGRFLTILNGVRHSGTTDEIAAAVPAATTAAGSGRRRALVSGH